MAQFSQSNQEYLESHDIPQLFESLMESLILEHPKDPKSFIAHRLSSKNSLSFEDLSNLLESFKHLSDSSSPHSASTKIIDLACSLLHCERASLFLYDASHNLLQMVVGKGTLGIVLEENSGFTWKVFKTEQIVNIHDAYAHPNFDASVDLKTGFKTESMLGVPVKNLKGSTIGVLLALNKHNASFSHKDENILLSLASQAGTLLETSILHQKAINNEVKAKALLKFIRKAAKDTPGQSLALELVAQAKNLLQADTCNIFMVNHSNDLLIPIASHSESDFRITLKQGLLIKAVENGEIINSDRNDPHFTNEFDEKFGYHTETILIVPIKNSVNKVIGIVQVTNKHSDSMFGDLSVYSKFDEDDIELLVTLNEIMGKKLEKLINSFSKGLENPVEHAVILESSFGKSKYKSQELPEGAIKESEEEEESKS